MIVLDTHIWVWWIHGDVSLASQHVTWLDQFESQGLGVSAISCWEVAKLVENNRLELPCPVDAWMDQALSYPGIRLLDLTPQIAIESSRLPEGFHRDPADQIIVATARVHNCQLLTADVKIIEYGHVDTLK